MTRIEWNEGISRWIVSTNRGDAMKARFVYLGSGPINHPKPPGIPGIRQFKGHTFHTSRWDYAYTGGDMSGNLVVPQDKRVAIIGTGATAMQVVPQLGKWAKTLYVVQRTPSSSTGAATSRPIRRGSSRCNPAGRNAGWPISTASWPVPLTMRLWSPMHRHDARSCE